MTMVQRSDGMATDSLAVLRVRTELIRNTGRSTAIQIQTLSRDLSSVRNETLG